MPIIEVEIPEGTYCSSCIEETRCPLLDSEYWRCRYYNKDVQLGQDEDDDCNFCKCVECLENNKCE